MLEKQGFDVYCMDVQYVINYPRATPAASLAFSWKS